MTILVRIPPEMILLKLATITKTSVPKKPDLNNLKNLKKTSSQQL